MVTAAVSGQDTDMFDFSNIDEPMDGFGTTQVR